MKKKTLLITHTDLDGISPIILLNLAGIKFEYKTTEIADLETTWNEYVEAGLENYDQIYFTDLTLTQEMYDYFNDNNINVKVFDHHETHLFANKYPYVTVKVDIDGVPTCATEIFYLYLKDLYKDKLSSGSLKQYVDYVRELDTYKFTSDIPREIDSLKTMYGSKDFIKSMTRRLKKNDEFKFTSFEKRLTKVKAFELQRYLEKKAKKMVTYEIKNHKVGVVFAETNKSDLGNYLATKNPDLEFIILIDASSRISYRAVRDDANVAEFATIFGGGGHKLASGSGFTDVDREKIVEAYFKDVKKIEI